jgi:RND family efflux transporter MFP subunit
VSSSHPAEVADPGVSEPLPRLREDVELLPKLQRGKHTGRGVLRDPKTREVYELGEREYLICRCLDGATPLEAIRERLEREFDAPAAREEVEEFVRQLEFEDLIQEPTTSGMLRSWDEGKLIPGERHVLFNPDRFLVWLHARIGWWFFSRPVAVASLCVIAFGAHLLVARWDELSAAMWAVWTLEHVLLLAAVGVLVVQVTHEFSHGLVCTHYGGHVTSAGVGIILRILPKFYLDRRQTAIVMHRGVFARCYVHLVGLHCQLFLASIGIIAAALIVAPDGPAYWFWTTLWSTALWGAVHNANIGRPRDLYFALSTWLGIQKLRERSVVAAMNWVARRPQPEPLSRYERRWFILFGFATVGYYVAHGLIMFWSFGEQITGYLEGPGVIVFVLVLLYVFQLPLLRRIRRPVRWLLASEAGWAKSWLVRFGWLLLLIVVLLIPYPYETGGPFAVLPTTQTQVHVEIDGGRIDKVFVREGDVVTAGQPLAVIDQREYVKHVGSTQAQLDNTRAQLALLRKQLIMLTTPPNIEQIQALEAEVRRLEIVLADYQQQVELTVIRAPVAARVTTPLIDQRVGQYLKKGDLFATLEQAQTIRAEIQVPEGDAPLVRVGAGVKVVLWAYPGETFTGSVTEVAPVAAVPSNSKVNSVRVVAELPNPDQRLKSNITGYAKIHAGRMLFGFVLSRLIIRWFQVQFWYWIP